MRLQVGEWVEELRQLRSLGITLAGGTLHISAHLAQLPRLEILLLGGKPPARGRGSWQRKLEMDPACLPASLTQLHVSLSLDGPNSATLPSAVATATQLRRLVLATPGWPLVAGCSVVQGLTGLTALNLGCMPQQPLDLSRLGSLQLLAFRHFADHTGVLDVHCIVLTVSLSALTNLRALDFTDTYIFAVNFPEQVTLLTALEELNMKGWETMYDAFNAPQIATLAGLPNLQSVAVNLLAWDRYVEADNDRGIILEELAMLPALQRVNLGRNANEDDMGELETLREVRGLNGTLSWFEPTSWVEDLCSFMSVSLFDSSV